ncbi:MAG: TrkA family potassium uptake protein [SAR202 cluster bacterium]|jgi:trk system potassium uptake protein TrkA|nr:TrkA family potassium uptake protein [SAR202 cluster bacterium]MDP7105206.1 TrkA family potassium uptake protein [SAR202 cluster bacterium]MDP7412580.1 TrkA family potassium uptake protein [SAR202 cluster bacterium]
MKRQIAVMGLGRFGSSVATSLYNLGHDVLAIDKDETRVQGIMGQATHALTGDCTNDAVLKELGISDYHAAVVAIGSDVVSSIMASVLLKTMGVPYVVSRAHNELHGNTLERIGVDKVVYAEEEMGNRLAHSMFNPNVEEYLEITPNFGISKLKIPPQFVNMSLKELGFSSPRNKYGLVVLAIRRGKDITLNPDTDDRLRADDWLVLAGRDDMLDRLEAIAEDISPVGARL